MSKKFNVFIVGGGDRLNVCLVEFIKSELKLYGVFVSKKENEKLIKKQLTKKKIKVFKKWNDFVKVVNGTQNAIVFFISHNKIIDPKIFKSAYLVNYHASPLPKYRGGSPMNWAIINGEKEFGVSIHELVKSPDAGSILMQEHFCIQDMNYLELVSRVHKAFLRLTKILLGSFNLHWQNRISQDQRLVTYFHQRKPENSKIDFLKMDSLLIYKMFNALPKPLPRPYFIFKRSDYIISSCKLPKTNFFGQPGRVIGNFEGGVIVVCKSGSIVLNKLIKKKLNKEYSAKKFLKSGDQLND